MPRAIPSALLALLAAAAPPSAAADFYEQTVLAETTTTLNDGGYAVDVSARIADIRVAGQSGRDGVADLGRARAIERAGEIARRLKDKMGVDRLQFAKDSLHIEALDIRDLGGGAYVVDSLRFRFTVVAYDF